MEARGGSGVLRVAAVALMLILGMLSTAASADPITIDFETFPGGPSNFGPPSQTISVAGATSRAVSS